VSRNRCEICDFKEGEGSAYSDEAEDESRRVVHSREHGGYYCTKCLVEISTTIRGYNNYKYMKELDEDDE